jgi:hypothetical protein
MICLFKKAKSLGMKTVLTHLSNEYYVGAPQELLAENTVVNGKYKNKLCGYYYTELCPSRQDGEKLLLDSFDALMEFATQCIDAKNAVLNSKPWAPCYVTFTWIPQDIEYVFNPWDEDTVEEAFELLDEDFKNALRHAKKDIEE